MSEASRGQAAPRRRATRWVAAAAALLAALAAGAVWWGWSVADGGDGLRLEVVDHSRAELVHTRPVRPGERFEVRHYHSVTRRLVVETFSMSADGIAIEELWFDQPGPNLPVGPEEIGGVTTTFLFEEGAFRVLHHGRLLPTLPLRVGSPGVDHVLAFADGGRLALLDVSEPGAFVELRVMSGGSG